MGSLPHCPGPKLKAYGGDLMSPEWEFLTVLDAKSAHGIIIKARMNNRFYAVKFFVYIPSAIQNPATEVYGDKMPWQCCQAFDWYFSPFENECRAFGRLKERSAESLAVKVYGWVALTASQIISKLVATGAEGPRLDKLPSGNIYGIIKDWVEMAPYDDESQRGKYDQMAMVKHFPRMLRNLHQLHYHGITVRDLKIDQYINGTLVDLSLASTVPHPYGPTVEGKESPWQPRWTYESLAAWDLFSFQKCIINRWKRTSPEFFKNRPRNDIPRSCSLQAYPTARAEDAGNIQSGRFRPILTYYGEEAGPLAMVQKPKHDPLKFLLRFPKYPRTIMPYGESANSNPPRRIHLDPGIRIKSVETTHHKMAQSELTVRAVSPNARQTGNNRTKEEDNDFNGCCVIL
ncbi:hypothetical protein IL306_010174 [Fusarium sp. DS 682]|nr:hypothetical protein IL306_010174 [Fusarium sp. DS 682]